ncbi:MAG: hypothetical protein ACHQET_09880 [Chitinophagales bacterium]
MVNIKPWLLYAVLSAIFAALTATFAKAGLKSVDSDLATAIRTSLVLLMVGVLSYLMGVQEAFNRSQRAHGLS